ncbi:hypothetical protein HK104_009781 [Borealophlyctis nickersoniae]|nr:hypothetical protein HK104_009781 [Borealophlyctis nickersoniae]
MKNKEFAAYAETVANETVGGPGTYGNKRGFCDICQRNYEEGKRHFYSTGHKEKVNFLVKRQKEFKDRAQAALKQATEEVSAKLEQKRKEMEADAARVALETAWSPSVLSPRAQKLAAPQRGGNAVGAGAHQQSESGLRSNPPKRRRTVAATATNLTTISLPAVPNEKNVHDPDSVPPWLVSEPSPSLQAAPEIGPSMESFLEAKKKEKKRKLNPNRVGANFDRGTALYVVF